MNQSEQINELAAALAKAQAAIRPAVKDKTNPAFRSKYADLGSVWEACREALTSNGLSVVQFPVEAGEPGRIALETTLLHASGQWLRAAFSLPLAKNDPQGAGSGYTYARRYALAAIVGVVADDDDDGNAASQPTRQPASYEPQQARAPRLPSQQAPAPQQPAQRPEAPAAVDGMTVEQAEQRFLAKFGAFEEHYAGIPRPTTVAGWVSAGQALRQRLQQADMDGADATLARNGAAGVAR